MPLFVIINTACGDKGAPAFFDQHVFPRLTAHGIKINKIVKTTSPGHAPTFLRDYIASNPPRIEAPRIDITVILGSGDGTLHEITEAVRPYALRTHHLVLRIVLIPCGTANALYFSLFPDTIMDLDGDDSKLRSLDAFLEDTVPKTISLAVTTVLKPDGTKATTNTAAVVTSTALHACILRDSESLRDEYPGTERFKVAAENNSTLWYHSKVRLHPVESTGKVEIYDPKTHSFSPFGSADGSKTVDIEGPFVYFTATVNVDRLEPTFRILPLMGALPPSSPCCDIAMVRPMRCPTIAEDSEDSRSEFTAIIWKILHGAYEDGSHVRHRYDANGEITTEGTGPTAVEYVRCGGWEWIPMENDPNAHIICCDGGIVPIGQGGSASCIVDSTGQFRVYA